MRTGTLLVCLALIATGCAPAGSPEEHAVADPAIDSQAVVEAHQGLVAAYEKRDTGAFLLLLDKSEDLLLFHPRLQDRWNGFDEIQRKLPGMFERLGESSWLDVHLAVSVESDVAWLTSQVLIESPGLETPFTGRGTEIWVRRGNVWRLRHGHWSDNPEF
jgi:ketosteroid isomerase-like protein